MDVLAAKAAGLAADGHRVFPVNSGAKEPLHKGWQEEATTDVERVAALWRGRVPEANIGIRTGGDVLVIDVDIKKGVPGIANWERLMADHGGQLLTRTVRTPSGGLHHYFAKPPELIIPNSAGRLGPGIDVRGDGGFVLGPGSVIGEAYELLHPGPILSAPDWLLALLTASPNGSTPKFETADTPIIEGGRSAYLVRYAGKQRAIGHTVAEVRALVVLENERTCRPPLSNDEIDATIMESVGRWERGETPGVIRHGGKTDDPDDESTRMSDVQAVDIRWLWRSRIAYGKLAIFEGDPDVGKGMVSLDLAARKSVGAAMPDGSPGDGVGDVLLITSEDGLEDTIKPRLDCCPVKPDMSRIRHLVWRTVNGRRRKLDITVDADVIRRHVLRHGIQLVILDPLTEHLPPGVSPNDDVKIRAALAPLVDLAEELGFALLVVRHLNKKVDLPSLYRGSGSIGLIAKARTGAVFAKMPEAPDGTYVMVCQKCNVAEKPGPFVYEIVPPLPGERTAHVLWQPGRVITQSAAELLAWKAPQDQGPLDEAVAFLQDQLYDGPHSVQNVRENAKASGISDTSLRKARERLGVKATKVGMVGLPQWSLPTAGVGT
jgi:hypothetical protein